MKVDVVSNVQQTKTELDEKFFSIADPAFIFDLLRNKIYSDPITAVCREVACNALDAQREVGKENIPVVIHLPSYSDLYFKVKDCGPGISPERMENIFLKYAASTKRDTNDQIGGFGIGAKSPFSYSDSFTIVTNVDGKSYNYAAFIDESRIGKLILLGETETTEPNGTEIIVPVKSQDINNFINATELCTRHWKVKPTIFGQAIKYRNVTPVISNDCWFITQSDNYSYYNTRNVKVLVGEIEYSLDMNAVKQFAEVDVMSSIAGDLYLKFNVGEVGLAANRETIYLDPQTKEAVKDRLSLVKKEYINLIKEKIEQCPSLFEANCFLASDLQNICTNTAILGKLTWNDIPLTSEIKSNDDIHIIAFTKGQRYNADKVTRTYCNGIRFTRNSKIIINDCGDVDPTPRHVKKFFEEDTKIKTLFVVSNGKDISLEDMLATYYLDQIDFELLSKHNSSIKNKKNVVTTAKTIIFKFDLSNESFTLTSASALKEDTKTKILVYLEKDQWRSNVKIPLRKNKIDRINTSVIASIIKMEKEISVYGVYKDVPEAKVKQTFSRAIFIDDKLDAIVAENSRDFLLESLWASNNRNYGFDWLLSCKDKINNQIQDRNCFFLEVANIHNSIADISNLRCDYLTTMSKLGVTSQVTETEMQDYITRMEKPEIMQLWNKLLIAYPMLRLVDRYNINDHYDKIVGYINLVNKN